MQLLFMARGLLGNLRRESSMAVVKGGKQEAFKGLTAAQKKLPKALQAAILKKKKAAPKKKKAAKKKK